MRQKAGSRCTVGMSARLAPRCRPASPRIVPRARFGRASPACAAAPATQGFRTTRPPRRDPIPSARPPAPRTVRQPEFSSRLPVETTRATAVCSLVSRVKTASGLRRTTPSLARRSPTPDDSGCALDVSCASAGVIFMSAFENRVVRLVLGIGLVAAFAVMWPAASAQQAPYDAGLYSGLRWRMLGPFRGGRVDAVSGVPGRPNEFYFGAVNGGVWKTIDAGRVWAPGLRFAAGRLDRRPGRGAVEPRHDLRRQRRVHPARFDGLRQRDVQVHRRRPAPGRTSAWTTRSTSARSRSIRGTRTSSSSPRSATCTTRTPTAACSAPRMADARGRRCFSRTTTSARSTS